MDKDIISYMLAVLWQMVACGLMGVMKMRETEVPRGRRVIVWDIPTQSCDGLTLDSGAEEAKGLIL